MLSSDGAFGRVFETAIDASPDNTVESCIDACIERNFTVAGVEFGVSRSMLQAGMDLD